MSKEIDFKEMVIKKDSLISVPKEREVKEIVIKKNSSISFPNAEEINGDILIIGNYNGICGEVKWDSNGLCEIAEDFYGMDSDVFVNNMHTLLTTIRNGNCIVIASSKDTILYFKHLLYAAADTFIIDKSRKEIRKMFNNCVWPIDTTDLYEATVYSQRCNEIAQKHIDDIVTNKIFEEIKKIKKKKDMKFDAIIQNPPYNKSLHLDFLEKGLDLLNENGKMVIVEPATWLINIRKNGKAKRYDAIKQRLEGHIESVVIENLNKEFGTGLYVPFATTTIDMSKTYDTIDCTICGEHKIVESIYDINLVGKYDTIWAILEKVQKYSDVMNSHITKEDKGGDYWYTKYAELTPDCGCSNTSDRKGLKYEGDYLWCNTHNGDINIGYIYSAFHTYNNEISNTPLCAYDRGKHLTDKITDNIYGTKSELENWKHFIFNNKLPLFINIVMTIDQHNNSKEYLPWLVDRQYSDDEINKMFGFTEEEIKLIDTTIKKYERNSPWFKRYMCGKDAVTDEEVNNFIAEINM